MKKIIKDIDLSMAENNITYIDYLDRIKLVATSLFKWNNLDKIAGTGAARFLEQTLYNYGRACFVKDDELGFLCLRVNPSDKLNVYNLPTKINAWSYDYNKTYDFDDIVYIKNNELVKPTLETARLFAYRLYDVERTIDLNLDAQKTPILIEGDTKSMLTLKNVYMQYNGNAPVIYGNKDFDLGNRLNVLKTDAPFLVEQLDTHKKTLLKDVYSFLGVQSPYENEKKERLITSEIENQNKNVEWQLNIWFRTRKEAADEINEKFLSDYPEEEQISVELNNDLQELLVEIQDIEGIEEDGEIHDNNQELDEQ